MISLERLPDWEKRLIDFANSWCVVEYEYGVTDCTRFAHGSVVAVTGKSLLPDMEWPTGWISAAKMMIAKGWESVESPVDELLPRGEAEVSRRGDLVSYSAGGELHLAVRVGGAALAPAMKGLLVIDRKFWLRSWKVG